jgi:sugar phosphate isomerase/epimerase
MHKIAVNSAHWYNEQKPEESIAYIASCGIEAIDYDICELFDATFDEETLTSFFDKDYEELCQYYDRMKKAMNENGIVFSQWHGLFPIYYPGEDAKNEYLMKVTDTMIALCSYMECPAIVMHPWTGLDISKEEEMQINLNLYRRMIPAAKKYGVMISLENLFKHYGIDCVEGSCADVTEAVRYIDQLNEEAGEEIFGFCLDTGHANIVKKNLYQYVTTLGHRLKLLHINDNPGCDDYHMIPYSQLERSRKNTSINWNEFLRGLKEIGYTGDLNFETHKAIKIFPVEVRKEVIALIASIGRYFRDQITK